METDNPAVILSGKVYELTERGSRHCRDCALYACCTDGYYKFCVPSADGRYIYRLNQELTDKINRQ